MISLTVTDMERLLQHPESFYTDTPADPDSHFFTFGKFFHMHMQNPELARILYQPKMLPLEEHLKYQNIVKKFAAGYHYAAHEFGVSHYNRELDIAVRGRIDSIEVYTHPGENSYVLVDYKTTADIKEWRHKQNILAGHHQWYIYPALFALEFKLPLDTILEFKYLVFAKHKTKADSTVVSQTATAQTFISRFKESLALIPDALERARKSLPPSA